VPDWQLVHPGGPAKVAALAAGPPPRTVVWLDELQHYLDGEHGLDGATVRALLGAPGPVVLIGTLWPDLYSTWTAVRTPGNPDPHPRERQVLGLADIVRIDAAFSPAEQDRARAAASRDPQLRAALAANEYGLTQTLAAAPQLVARWEDAQPYEWAVLTAALDAARLGARAPLTAGFLRTAAPDYCTSTQQAEAPADWFEQALAYAAASLHGAAAALAPSGRGMGQIDGYTVADYLLQHATRKRRATCVPASTWDALLIHVSDPADTARLADSASSRLLYRYAIPLYHHAADAGDENAAWQLADLLLERGDLDGLRARAAAGDGSAAGRLADLLAGRGDLDGLRARADAGDGSAARQLADLLAGRGDLDGAAQILRPHADAGDRDAARQLAGLLLERGDLDGLRARADAGDEDAAWQLRVCRSTWAVTWSSSPAAVMPAMTSPMASVVSRPPRRDRNRAGPSAPGQDGRSASHAARASRSLAWTGARTVRDFSPLPISRRAPLRADSATSSTSSPAVSAIRAPA
jgi:hypothetical protein